MEKDWLTWNRKGENEGCVDMSGHGKKRNVGQFVDWLWHHDVEFFLF